MYGQTNPASLFKMTGINIKPILKKQKHMFKRQCSITPKWAIGVNLRCSSVTANLIGKDMKTI